MRGRGLRTLVAAACLLTACTSTRSQARLEWEGRSRGGAAPTHPSADGRTSPAVPDPLPPRRHRPWRPAHVVVVVEENHSFRDIIGSGNAPYINRLARHGANLTHSFAITHPSEPNYLALFSGSTQGLVGDGCPLRYRGRTLASQLHDAGRTFVGYSEGLPHTGSLVCNRGNYVRRHVPWTNFPSLPRSVNRPFSAFPTDYTKLPDVSFVIPNMIHDMHDGTIAMADSWLHSRLRNYVTWARTHDSVLIVTWDEDDFGVRNQIPTIIAGSHVKPGRYRTHVDLYRMLRTIEWLVGLPGLHKSKKSKPITQLWERSG